MSSIGESFAVRARLHPKHAAVVDAQQGKSLTYNQLSNAVLHLARRLMDASKLSNFSCGGGGVAAMMLPSSIERMISYYAILMAGLSFCPLEKGWPVQVMGEILQTIKPAVIVVLQSDDLQWLPDERKTDIPVVVIDIDKDLARDISSMSALPLDLAHLPEPSQVAHIIFTSGTSGTGPKAVMCGHTPSLLSHAARVPASVAADQRFGCAVFGVWDAVAAHLVGGPAIMLPDAALRDPELLASLIAVNEVQRMLLTPTLMDMLLSVPASCAALSLLVSITLCGELPSRALVERAIRLLPVSVDLINLFSSCECHDIALGDLRSGSALKPLEHVRVHVVDNHGNEVMAGATGTLLVSGKGLAIGYLHEHKDEAPCSRFAMSRLQGKQVRTVRTGDRARALSYDDQKCCTLFELVGRDDDVVKVRGSAIDLDQVEGACYRCFAGETRACAAVTLPLRPELTCLGMLNDKGPESEDVSTGTEIGLAIVWEKGASAATLPADAIRTRLAMELSQCALPLLIRSLPELPIDKLAGKCDRREVRRQLLLAEATTSPTECGNTLSDCTQESSHNPKIASLSESVRAACAAMERVLGQPDGSIGPDDDFFALGGHSVAAVQLSRILDVRISDLITRSTPRALMEPGDAIVGHYTDLHRTVQTSRQRALAEMSELTVTVDSYSTAQTPRVVLFTGATGGIGIAVLRELLKLLDPSYKIICLLRAADNPAALARLHARLGFQPPSSARLGAQASDLAAPCLGLDESVWRELLCNNGGIHAVVHAAAVVDRLAPLTALIGPNVHATARLVRLAELARAPLLFVSSSAALPPRGTPAGNAVALWPERCGAWCAALEGSLHTSIFHGGTWEGYAQSKWASEQLVSSGNDMGLENSCILRFGSLAGDEDLLAALVASTVVGMLPSSTQSIDWLPREEVVRTIVDWVISPTTGRTVVHRVRRLPLNDLCAALEPEGKKIRIVPPREWREAIATYGNWEGNVVNSTAVRIESLLETSSGLEGALGLCEAPLSCSGTSSRSDGTIMTTPQSQPGPLDDVKSCAEAVLSLLVTSKCQEEV